MGPIPESVEQMIEGGGGFSRYLTTFSFLLISLSILPLPPIFLFLVTLLLFSSCLPLLPVWPFHLNLVQDTVGDQ